MELLIEKMNPSYKMENATTSVNEQDGHKAFVYARLSKDERGKKKYSLENQKDIAIRYAAEHGIHILRFLEDDDLSRRCRIPPPLSYIAHDSEGVGGG